MSDSEQVEGDLPEDQHECGDDREVVGNQLGQAKSGSGRKNPGPLDQQLPQVVGVAHLENQVQDSFLPALKTHQAPPAGDNQAATFDGLEGLEVFKAGGKVLVVI